MDRAHNLWDVIDSEPHYTHQCGSNFVVIPKKKIYDDSIAKDTTTSRVRTAEANHIAKRTDHNLYNAANKFCVQFIIDVVR